VLFRVIVAVLAVFGGAGVLLYVIGWLLIPDDGERATATQAFLGRMRGRPLAQAALAVVAVLAALAVIHDRNGAVLLAGALGLTAFLVLRDRPAHTASAPAATAAVPPVAATVAPTRPPRERSPLGPLTVSVGLLVLGSLLALDAGGTLRLTLKGALASLLLVVGVGLLVGAWLGSARWLAAPALLLALALGVLQAVAVPLHGGAGDRQWTVSSLSDLASPYRLAVGHAQLDLSGLAPPAGTERVVASVGAGRLVVFVPQAATVRVHGHAGVGDVQVFGADVSGLSADRAAVSEGNPSGGSLDLDVSVGVGEVVVTRAAS
ncbi:MAG: LiaF-related protein, partial [Actinomycetota bacterium]|nr:LiaF-related protein [Actinomycetota bacterium]